MYVVSAFRRTSERPAKAGHYLKLKSVQPTVSPTITSLSPLK
jgi:hypothetical protein